jgi:hypothetical protein
VLASKKLKNGVEREESATLLAERKKEGRTRRMKAED